MNMKTPFRAFDRLKCAAVIGVFALIAVGCGVNTEQITDDAAAALPPAPFADNPVEYGASIEEWDQAVSDSNPGQEPSPDAAEQAASDAPMVVWEDLIQPGFTGREIVARYQDRLDAVEPGSAESAALYDEMNAEYDPEAVNTELDGQRIRLAGFVAPLTYDDDLVVEFLLVPTFGACIHVPPPPPNQTVMVTLDKSNGLTTDEAWGAVWVEGTITIEAATTTLASASYTITNATSGVRDDF